MDLKYVWNVFEAEILTGQIDVHNNCCDSI